MTKNNFAQLDAQSPMARLAQVESQERICGCDICRDDPTLVAAACGSPDAQHEGFSFDPEPVTPLD